MEVNPQTQNIDSLFSTTNYYIDFYQREYKWKDDEVSRLIDDIFYHFDQSYASHTDLDPTADNIAKYYSWYYLNTYITNRTGGRVFVVDGQQRLTTLTLMLIALYHMCEQEPYNSPKMRDWLQAKIAGVGIGGQRQFWMAHDKRDKLMQALYTGVSANEGMLDDGVTAKNIIENFNIIKKDLIQRLSTKHKFDTFIWYYLCMVVIINLEVAQTDVPMVFEVINDRGVRLQSYEILKGKLLGLIDKNEVDTYADIWEKSLHEIEAKDENAVDTFFRTYLKARFSELRQQGQIYDGPYHRVIFDPLCNDTLHLKHSAKGVKEFLNGPFQYYSKLYLKLLKLGEYQNSKIPECYYSSQLNRMDSYIMLVLAACSVNDKEEDAKISAISLAYDRAYVMLQLNRAYDSNQFQELLYRLNPILRESTVEDMEKIINNQVVIDIKSRKNTTSESLLTYAQFKQVGYNDYNTRFLRYFLTRIEMFIADGLKSNTNDDIYNYVSGTGKSNAYHIEHILARNDESRALFKDKNGEVDEELFESERNRFGGLLLLKGQDNSSSNNELYKDKLRTYTGSAPYLAQTLVPDYYKSNSAMLHLKQQSKIEFEPAASFTRESLEKRSELLYAITKKIWLV